MTPLPQWPVRERYGGKDGTGPACNDINNGMHALIEMFVYERARAEAALARLKVAVEALQKVEHECALNEWMSGLVISAHALASIGPLPPEVQP